MSMQGPKTKAAYQRAKAVIPYGVNSNFRYWGDDDTLVIARGQGAYIWDLDDRRYIDYRLGFGPVILGHAHPRVDARVKEALEGGVTFAWTTPWEIEAAERIVRLTGVDKVRLTNTGTEATFHALRIARAYTNREKFIKFEGQYHGQVDYFMFSNASSNKRMIGSRRSPIPAAATSGIPKAVQQYIITLPFNDFDAVERTVKAKWGDIAAIIVEPVLGNLAGIMPKPGFLEHLRRLADEYGIVLIFDEVKTGFRIAKGGAQEYFGVRADLVTYAKSLGNGYPVAAIAGREEVMMTIQPGAMAHGGTYSGNAVAAAAAAATLQVLEEEDALATVEARGRALMEGIRGILAEEGIPAWVGGPPSMFGVVLGVEDTPWELRDYLQGDAELYEEIGMELIRRGVMPDADGREPWFLCAALSDEDVAYTLDAFRDAVRTVKGK